MITKKTKDYSLKCNCGNCEVHYSKTFVITQIYADLVWFLKDRKKPLPKDSGEVWEEFRKEKDHDYLLKFLSKTTDVLDYKKFCDVATLIIINTKKGGVKTQ